MEKKLFEIITRYAKAGEALSKDFYDEIAKLIIEERDLGMMVSGVETVDVAENTADVSFDGGYHSMYDKIILSPKVLEKRIKNEDSITNKFNSDEKRFYPAFCVVQTLLHELDHAYRFKEALFGTDNSIESQLTSSYCKDKAQADRDDLNKFFVGLYTYDELRSIFTKKREKYIEYYSVNVLERLAECMACQSLTEVFRPVKDDFPNLFNITLMMKMAVEIKGYREAISNGNSCPAEMFLKAYGYGEIWKNLDFYDPNMAIQTSKAQENHDLNKRLILGLPISNDEFKANVTWLRGKSRFYE